LCARLVRLRVKLVALERPDGLLIERLLDAGLAVVAVHRIRSRRAGRGTASRVARAMSLTAFVLAEARAATGQPVVVHEARPLTQLPGIDMTQRG